MKCQLPNDIISIGYKQTKPFHYEQVFYSKEHDFKGTEKDFVKANLGYYYAEKDKYTRLICN